MTSTVHPNPLVAWATDSSDFTTAQVLISLWSDLLWYCTTQDGVNTHYCRLTGFLLALRVSGAMNEAQHHAALNHVREWIVSLGLSVPVVPVRRDGLEPA